MKPAVLALSFALTLGFVPAVQAQDETLADIRQELSVLFVEIQRLKRELSTTGAGTTIVGGDTLQRVDLIEAELRRLTAATENLEFRIGRVVQDGTNRVGDLEFRLCELEPECDIGSLGETPSLGGESASVTPQVSTVETTQLAVGEQADFDAARSALDAGNFRSAAELFETFTATYTGGPLTSEAQYLRGEALAGLGDWQAAGRAYLESYSSAPTGNRAPDALLKLGVSLANLGQVSEACATLGAMDRFPGSAQLTTANAERQRLGCS